MGRGVQIIAEFRRFLAPDGTINLKEPDILRILFATHHLAILGKVPAPAFTLGDPLHHRRQGLLLHKHHFDLRHHVQKRAVVCLRLDDVAQERASRGAMNTRCGMPGPGNAYAPSAIRHCGRWRSWKRTQSLGLDPPRLYADVGGKPALEPEGADVRAWHEVRRSQVLRRWLAPKPAPAVTRSDCERICRPSMP